jgi:cytosine deaminase
MKKGSIMFKNEITALKNSYKGEQYDIAFTLLEEAYSAYAKGNFGIASLIYKNGSIIAYGQNRMVFPTFASGMHAEMDAINTLENDYPKLENLSEITLYSSLEPCPMCLTRIINSGIANVYYLATDKLGGGVSYLDAMPPIWKELSAKVKFRKMQLPAEFENLAVKLAFANAEKIHQIIISRQ